jgi:hypothetical protein
MRLFVGKLPFSVRSDGLLLEKDFGGCELYSAPTGSSAGEALGGGGEYGPVQQPLCP